MRVLYFAHKNSCDLFLHILDIYKYFEIRGEHDEEKAVGKGYGCDNGITVVD